MAWVVLCIAGLFEIAWVIALKYSEGFTRLLPSIIFGFTAWMSFACLAYALKSLPVGTAYAVWTGIGAVGVAIFGIVWFGESASAMRLGCIAMIVAGILGLKLSAGSVV